jgi:hypothetical protein
MMERRGIFMTLFLSTWLKDLSLVKMNTSKQLWHSIKKMILIQTTMVTERRELG